jgi:thymidylate synthase
MIKVDFDYMDILDHIFEDGVDQKDRTSVGSSRQIFGAHLRFNTHDKFAPFIQCRTFAPRIAFEEWKWMMQGDTNAETLMEKNIHIWDGNSSREFLDSRGLQHVPTNHIGKAYGYQYRSFGGKVDQIQNVFNSLKYNPTGRRHVVEIWNPAELHEMALEPCFHLYEFMVSGDTLNLYAHGRSSDHVFGLPYNLGFSFFWLLTFSRALGYKTGEIMITATNSHIYANQVDLVDAMLNSFHWQSLPIPKVTLTKEVSTLDDILNLEFTDFVIENFTKGPTLTDKKIEMAV